MSISCPYSWHVPSLLKKDGKRQLSRDPNELFGEGTISENQYREWHPHLKSSVQAWVTSQEEGSHQILRASIIEGCGRRPKLNNRNVVRQFQRWPFNNWLASLKVQQYMEIDWIDAIQALRWQKYRHSEYSPTFFRGINKHYFWKISLLDTDLGYSSKSRKEDLRFCRSYAKSC